MSSLPPPLPVLIDLAPLPRTQIGPFLILGIDKDADRDTLEANWAQRLDSVRKSLIKVPLEDINWAREVLTDPDARVRADATSLNVDTTDGVLEHLRQRFQGGDQKSAPCRPLDVEKNLANYDPAIMLPDSQEVRLLIPTPQIPRELPAVRVLLEELANLPRDAWDINLE